MSADFISTLLSKDYMLDKANFSRYSTNCSFPTFLEVDIFGPLPRRHHIISKSMAKQYTFNITVNEQDAVPGTSDHQKTNISKGDLSLLAANMSSENMSKFAEKYLDITQNRWGYNYTLLKYWSKKAGEDGKQVRK